MFDLKLSILVVGCVTSSLHILELFNVFHVQPTITQINMPKRTPNYDQYADRICYIKAASANVHISRGVIGDSLIFQAWLNFLQMFPCQQSK